MLSLSCTDGNQRILKLNAESSTGKVLDSEFDRSFVFKTCLQNPRVFKRFIFLSRSLSNWCQQASCQVLVLYICVEES